MDEPRALHKKHTSQAKLLADNEVVTSNSDVEKLTPLFEILGEWEAHLKSAGYDVDDFAVDNPQPEEPQP